MSRKSWLRRRLRGALCLALSAWAGGAGAAPGTAEKHPGPLGLAWGKSPADARTLLAHKLTFVSQDAADSPPYDTVDQHYTGAFAKLPTVDIFLRFHRGKFFYLMVTLATPEPMAVSKVWEQVVNMMEAAYGKPVRLVEPTQLASAKAIVGNLPLTENRDYVLPLLWNERTHLDEASRYQLGDLQIRSGLWDPFAGWHFANGVTVQTFIFPEQKAAFGPAALKPLWIFSKDDLFRRWKADVHKKPKSPIVEPRDF